MESQHNELRRHCRRVKHRTKAFTAEGAEHTETCSRRGPAMLAPSPKVDAGRDEPPLAFQPRLIPARVCFRPAAERRTPRARIQRLATVSANFACSARHARLRISSRALVIDSRAVLRMSGPVM